MVMSEREGEGLILRVRKKDSVVIEYYCTRCDKFHRFPSKNFLSHVRYVSRYGMYRLARNGIYFGDRFLRARFVDTVKFIYPHIIIYDVDENRYELNLPKDYYILYSAVISNWLGEMAVTQYLSTLTRDDYL